MRARCNDIDVAWFEVGRGAPLILIHGLADDHRAWRRALPDLVLRHRVLMYDLRGHGETSLGRPDGTLTQLAADLASLMKSIGVGSADVAGFSLGGTIAMRMAIDHPELVKRLVLVATSSRVGKTAADWYRRRVDMVEQEDPELRATLDRDTADVYAQAPAELDPELAGISAPTLIVASELDRHCPPKAAEVIAAGIKGSRMEVIAGAGHPIPVEKPRELAGSMNAFLAI